MPWDAVLFLTVFRLTCLFMIATAVGTVADKCQHGEGNNPIHDMNEDDMM